MKRFQLLLLCCLSGLLACTSEQQEKEPHGELKKLTWLLGDWANTNKKASLHERWWMSGDSVFTGEGYELIQNDTVFQEKLSLVMKGNELFYVPTVSGQNDNQPVFFKVIEISDSGFVCENPDHDFPQIIRYRLESPMVLIASIEGELNGEEMVREFHFRKATVRLMP